MISAAPLYSGVHNWTGADRVRMCGINEDRRTPLSDEESKSSSTQPLGCEERCVSSVLSKVDITPAPNQSDALMLQEDGGAQVGAGQRLEEKPPDPAVSEPAGAAPVPKTRGKARAQAANMLDTNVQTVSSKHGKKVESARTPALEKAAGTDPPALRPADADPSTKQKPILGPGLQIAGQPVEASHAVVSSSFGTLTPFTMSRICFSTTQVPAVQKLPLTFPTGAVLAPSQPLVYIPPANCGQALSVATLPTTFGVTPTLTLPMLPACLQDRCLLQTSSDMHAFASSLGRPLTTEPKVASTETNKAACTAPSITLTNSNSVIASTTDGAPASTNTTSSTLAALQTLTAHPTYVNVNPIALTTYSRAPSSLEPQSDSSSSSVSPLKSPPQLEREMVSPPDAYEMPLDLSSKSHRHKHAPSNQRKTPPMPVLTPVHTSGKASLSTVLSRSDCTSQRLTPNTSSSVNQTLRGAPLVMFPEFLRNGDPGSTQLAPGSWIKNSAALISTIPGTYVGVANPVPASVLLNKDSNMSLNTDSRHLAKQEPISIIDQGEPKNSGSCSKKNSQANTVDGQQPAEKRNLVGRVATVNSVCPSKDWTLPGHGTVHPKCPLNGKPSNSQVLPVNWSPYHQTSLLSIGLQATSTLHSNQGPPHRLPVTEYALFPNILPAESNATPQSTAEYTLNAQLKNAASTGAPPEQDLLAKARTCEALSKPHKPHANKTLLAPKPSAGNNAACPQPGTADKADCSANSLQGPPDGPLSNKISDKTNYKDKIRPKLSCSRKIFGEAKPKNKVLASYMTNDQLSAAQPSEASRGFPLQGGPDCTKTDLKADPSQDQPAQRKRSHKKAHAPEAVHEVDLSKVKIERIDDDEESFGRLPTFNDSASWSPVMEMPPITKVKARVKKEPGLRGRLKQVEELTPNKTDQPKAKCKGKRKEDADKNVEETPKRKWKRRSASVGPEKKEPKAVKAKKEPADGRTKRRRRKAIKSEPLDPEYDLGNYGFSDIVRSPAGPFPKKEDEEDAGTPCKRRKLRRAYKGCRTRRFTSIKEEPEPEMITPPMQNSWEVSNRGLNTGKSPANSEPENEGDENGTLRRRKRRRQKNRKYQNGEYLTEKEEEEVSQCFRRRRSRTGPYKRKLSPDSLKIKISPSSRDNLRQGSSKGSPEHSLAQMIDKPSGKRKCKTKHLGGSTDEERKGKGRRSLQSPKFSPLKSPRKSSEPGTPYRSRRSGALGSCDQHIPPEARKLIVNKNAGETLLQRAARLGYKDVVLFCLQRDPGDINHRDNAGYTALHEACSRGWTDILQVLLDNGANVNCSAQDGTRPIHDAVVNDNIETVWQLLSYGADPTLATYSGQTPMKLASSDVMRTFLSDYLSDLRGRTDGDPRASWDFYSSSVLDAKDEAFHADLLDPSETSKKEDGEKDEEDNFLFEFSEAPLIPCYNLQVSLTSGPGNWFLISDVLKKMKLSSRIFQARFPHFEIASMQKKEFTRQAFTSQILTPSEGVDLWPQDSGETVELIRYEAELIRLLGSTVEFQCASS